MPYIDLNLCKKMGKICNKYRKIQNFILEYRKIQNELGIQKNTENTEKYRHTLRPVIMGYFIALGHGLA